MSIGSLAKKLALIREVRKGKAASGEKLPEILSTQDAPAEAERILAGQTGTPEKLASKLRGRIPRNVVDMLYGDVVNSTPRGQRMRGEDFAKSFKAPSFGWERPVQEAFSTDYLDAAIRERTARGLLQDFDAHMRRVRPEEWGHFLVSENRFRQGLNNGRIEDAFRGRIADSTLDISSLNAIDSKRILGLYLPEVMEMPGIKDSLPLGDLSKRFYGYQSPIDFGKRNYFERVLTSDDPAVASLPDDFFATNHFDTRRPSIGHVRGYSADLDFGLSPTVFIDELQSDLLRRMQAYQSGRKKVGDLSALYDKNADFVERGLEGPIYSFDELRHQLESVEQDLPSIYDIESVKIPGVLENVYGNLAKAALQRAAQTGHTRFGIVTPESAALARDIRSPAESSAFQHMSAAEKDAEMARYAKERSFIDRVYNDALDEGFYTPMENKYGLQFREVALPREFANEDYKYGAKPYYLMTDIPEDVRRDIIERGIPGFNSGGLAAL